MKYAILSDIHSNLTALQAVLRDIEAMGGVTKFWCLGDIVGYGPDPHECIGLIRERCTTCIAGNHDWAAIGKISTAEFNPEAAEAAKWNGQSLTQADREYLANLPLTLKKGDFTLVHGSPREPIWEYVLSVSEAQANLRYFETKYCLIGHSHVPMLFECSEAQNCTLREPEIEAEIKLGEQRLIINPGGVGQPRDGDPRASYAVFDDDSNTLTLHRVEYDIPSVQERMEAAGLPFRLIRRLAFGL